jgi:hypothetical protein
VELSPVLAAMSVPERVGSPVRGRSRDARRKMIVSVWDQSKSIEGANYARVLYGILGHPAQRYCRAHSMVSSHHNSLNFKRKISPLTD